MDEGTTFDTDGGFAAPEKVLSINFNKAKTKFCLSLHYNGINSYFFINEKENYKFKASNRI